MELLLLDNHDSFTYNIAHIIRATGGVNLQIITSDRIDPGRLSNFDKIIFSPGPDIPHEGDIMDKILKRYKSEIPILGICLGLQAIVLHFGGKIERLNEVVHGRTKIISHYGNSSLFKDIPSPFEAGLYHSWLAGWDSIPDSLEITASSDKKRVMALRHKTWDIEAVQFHPESIMTPHGPEMISNWLKK